MEELDSTNIRYTEEDEAALMQVVTEASRPVRSEVYKESDESVPSVSASETDPEQANEPSRENHIHDGDFTIENDLNVGGTLRAKHFVHPFGGRFDNFPSLYKEYPLPHIGWWAWVGVDFPGEVWHCEKEGEWSRFGIFAGDAAPTVVDRGPWDASAEYYAGDLNPDTDRYETSDVWYRGCRYRCAKTGTHTAPAWGNPCLLYTSDAADD